MSKYTITIKNLLDNGFDFGLRNYPIFDESYRSTLNQNILYHYYESEIGLETPELFKFYLNQKMNEIMGYYNVLYNKQKSLLDNLENNVNLTETFDRKTDTNTSTNSNSNSSGTSNNKNLFLDTPQGNTYKGTIDDTDYATNVTFDRNSNTNAISDSSTSSGDANENYIKTIIGNNGSKYNIDLLNDIKNNLMNIDLLIINELGDLFMGLF